MSKSTITLPGSVDELRNTIKIAIACYSETPVKNEKKLERSLAISLGLKSSNQLHALLKEQEEFDNTRPYDIDFCTEDDHYLVINGYYIPVDLAHQEVIGYTVADRQDRIEFLYEQIATSDDPYDLELMKEDLHTLEESECEHVLECYGTNGFLAGDSDPVEFNKVCDELIETAKEHFNDVCKTEENTGDKLEDIKCYWGQNEYPSVYTGELVLISKLLVDGGEKLEKDICRFPYEGTVPKGFAPAFYRLGEWHAIEIVTRVTVRTKFNESLTVFDMHDDDKEFEPLVDIVMFNADTPYIADAALDVYANEIPLSLPEQFTLTVFKTGDEETTYTPNETPDSSKYDFEAYIA